MASDSTAGMKSAGVSVLRWGLFLLVLWYVGAQASKLWDANQDIDVQFEWTYLIAAGVISQVSWLPSTWFWQRLIEQLGEQNVQRYPLIRAYFCGSLGKYIPGKAAVILIRSALLKKQGVSFVRASIASIVEAGAVMLVGCVVTIVFAMTVMPAASLPAWLQENVPRDAASWSGLLVAVAVLIAAMPIVAIPANWVFGKITRIVEKRAQLHQSSVTTDTNRSNNDDRPDSEDQAGSTVGRLTWKFLVVASLMFGLAWAGHGLSLLLVLRSMNPEILSVDSWTVCTAAAAAGTSIGFFAVFAPGGLAVREGLIITMLAPSTGGPMAVAAAGVYRLVSLTAECLAALILYVVAPRTVDTATRHEPPANTDASDRGHVDRKQD